MKIQKINQVKDEMYWASVTNFGIIINISLLLLLHFQLKKN